MYKQTWEAVVTIGLMTAALFAGQSGAGAAPPVIPPDSGAGYTMSPSGTETGWPGPQMTPAQTAASPAIVVPTVVPDPTQDRSPNPDAGLDLAPLPSHIIPLPSMPAAQPEVQQNYTFSGLAQSGFVPSDSSAAGGPLNVVEEVNSRIAIYSRTGSVEVSAQSLQQWYGRSGDSIFDTHVMFEPQHQRFFTLAEDGTTNSWLLRVSMTDNATGSWCTYVLGALNSGSTSVDFPLIGSSTNNIILTIVEKPANGNRVYQFPKSEAESCQTLNGLVWTDVTDPGLGTTAHPLVPVLNYNKYDTNGFMIDSYSDGGAHVSLYKINSSNQIIAKQVSTPSYTDPAPAHQPGSSVVISSGNTSISQAVNYYHGIDAALTTANGSDSSDILFMRFDGDTQTLTTSISVTGGPGVWFFYPSASQASAGPSLITYSISGTNIYVGAAVLGLDTSQNITKDVYLSVGHFDTPQSSNDHTCAGLPCSRWGDFTTTHTDPAAVNDFWSTAQTMISSTSWGTVIGQQSSS